ncbi:MAG: helix-hairpin-helix domain-containing protein [Crocinitomicaceae bacterium]|nr:helix-hairpin-helix domain-containing protein [Crocinitomicaceae bacterium]
MNKPKKISNRKARGVYLLLLIIAIVILTPRIYYDLQPNSQLLLSFKEIDNGISKMEMKQYLSVSKYKKKSKKYHAPPAKFDPNKYSLEEWMALGLSEKQANVVVNFAKRGIKNNEQLHQIFVIDEVLYGLIRDSTVYPEKYNRFERNYSKKKDELQVELNKATVEDLDKLPGIGTYFANKIIAYREKLGGFYDKSQLLEIQRFDEQKLNLISKNITIDYSYVKLININTCTVAELKKHPYLDWNVANSIVKMRAKFKKYTNFDQLLESELISIELFNKITPYLTIED